MMMSITQPCVKVATSNSITMASCSSSTYSGVHVRCAPHATTTFYAHMMKKHCIVRLSPTMYSMEDGGTNEPTFFLFAQLSS